MNDAPGTVGSPLVKLATAWAAVGVTTWADLASFLAALYSVILISEWTWKKVIRPALVRMGYLKDE